jgi:hypothetical protein
MMDRQKVIEAAKHCVACNMAQCDACEIYTGNGATSCIKQFAEALLDTPDPSDLTPYLTAAASDEELDRWSRAMWRTLGLALQSADAARGK